jgi:hypothetical protein
MRTGLLFIILLLLLPVALVMQDLLPAIPPLQERIFLLPLVFCFGVMALPPLPALFFGLATALVQGLSLLQIQSGEIEIGLLGPIVFFLGWTMLLQMIGESIRGMRWEVHAFASALVTFTLLAGEFLLLCFKRGGFPLDEMVGVRCLVPSAAALLMAPLVYFFLQHLVPYVPDYPVGKMRLPGAES